MKHLLSFLFGVLLTSVFFTFYLKNRLAGTTPDVVTERETIPGDAASPGLPDGFRKFYENFHRDSIFQLNHIHFPLEGIPEKETEDTDFGNFYWKKENWNLHRPFNAMDGSFIREFHPVGENIVIENILHTEANYGMQRRFSKDGDDWYLIYYAAMNKLVEPEVESELQ